MFRCNTVLRWISVIQYKYMIHVGWTLQYEEYYYNFNYFGTTYCKFNVRTPFLLRASYILNSDRNDNGHLNKKSKNIKEIKQIIISNT